MKKKDGRTKRFENRVRKTYERYGYLSLDSMLKSYFTYYKCIDNSGFIPYKQREVISISYKEKYISPQRLNQILSSLEKANKVRAKVKL